MSLYMEFVGRRQVHRISRPCITGIGVDRRAMEENARGVMSWLVLSRIVGSSVYRLDPVTMMLQNRKGEVS
jgi:hypothetical protein